MTAATHILVLPGPMLAKGFWLYVWRAEAPGGEYLYVGHTGDSSSPNAASPYQRMGQHLGHQKRQNALRKHLEKNGIEPEQCIAFQMIAYGPCFLKQKTWRRTPDPGILLRLWRKRSLMP